MIGWICYYKEDANKNSRYIDFYIEEGLKKGIQIILVYVEDIVFGTRNSKAFLSHQGIEISNVDFVINRAIHPLLTKQMEAMGIPCYNNYKVSSICNNKSMTYQYISQLHINMVDSIFCLNHQLVDIMDRIVEPTVIKAVAGHGGSQVFLYGAEDSSMKETIIEGIGVNDFVVQPLVGSRREDLRVYVIGGKIVASVLRKGQIGFKANYSLGGHVSLYNLSEQEEKIVYEILSILDVDMVGIDFIIGDSGELIFNEIEDVVGARMLYQCSDINLVDLYLEHIIEKQKGLKSLYKKEKLY